MSATFIPVFVERLALDGERRAWRSISSVVSVAVVLLATAAVLAWCAAPWIVDGFTFLQHASTIATREALTQQRNVATAFLRWFVPQIFFYGVIGIATALLNIRNKFAPGSWTPVANNLVCIAVLVWFHLVDGHPTIANANSHHDLAWLAVGTTAGVAVQFVLLVPSLATSDLGRVRFRFDLGDPAVRTVGRLGAWTLGVVLTNQASLYVILALAFATGGNGPVSAYTYGWSFMQMPYAVVVVSVLGVLTPQLAALASAEDFGGLSRRLQHGLRQSLVIILPCTVMLVVLAQPLAGLLLNHAHASSSLLAGSVLAVLGIGLPGFTVFQLCVRGLQSLQRARDVFVLYVIENALTVALCFVIGHHSIKGITASVSLAYTASAVVAVVVLARRRVAIASVLWGVHVRRSLLASAAMTVVMAAAYAALAWNAGFALLVRTVLALVVGALSYGAVALLGHQKHGRRQSV
jgi:putative peptidoglycan lipid II flippase